MLKTVLTGFVLGIVLILFVPSALILASWNAVPGNSTYQIKVGLEKAILGIAPSDNLKTTLEIKYTERRFTEVEKLISTKTTNITQNTNTKLVNTSLINLTNQAIASKNSLQKIQNSAEKVAQTEILISTLESISQKIEETKQTSPTSTLTLTPTKKNSPTPTIKNSEPVESTPTPPKTTLIITSAPTIRPTLTITPTPIKNSEPSESAPTPGLEDAQGIIDGIVDELKESSVQSTSNNKIEKNNSKKSKDNSSNENNQDQNAKDKNSRDRNDRQP